MNNPKSVAYGWAVLIVAAAGSYYFARKDISAKRLEYARQHPRDPTKPLHEILADSQRSGDITSSNAKGGSSG
ncbi:hypothetical protein PIIN_10479 [Serendipita indica DSM 11827]|uniref:Uncharacterized protein n=1 Tax=Serendipita indica (strain DSM 11827) TaxID=1109443 RepID=G4TYU3_SERID|nr:hypothetical protein PIIN_10479 [Serendipita indica DSM 11827]